MISVITKLLHKLQEMGKTTLFIEHNVKFVMDTAERIIVLQGGNQIAAGHPLEIRQNETVIEAYLGKA